MTAVTPILSTPPWCREPRNIFGTKAMKLLEIFVPKTMAEKKHVVVFDMNGVLFSKSAQPHEGFQEQPVPVHCSTVRAIHPSTDLAYLKDFFDTHSFYKVAWTTMMRHNAEGVLSKITALFGLDFDRLLTQEDCLPGEMVGNIKTPFCVKDLSVPSAEFKVDISNCLLVDDSPGKRCGEQNFHLYGKTERPLISALKYIDGFIGCRNENCFVHALL